MPSPYPSWVQQILATGEDVAFVLDEGLRIKDCNPAWDIFAALNGGVGVSGEEVRGRGIFEFVPDVLTKFYEQKYMEVRRDRGRWLGFDYECSTAEQYRLIHMALHAFSPGDILVINSHLRHRVTPLPRAEDAENVELYRSFGGSITMCAHCRKTKRQADPQIWDWVPQFLRLHNFRVSHGLCPRCMAYLYPGHESKSSQ